jgi:D-alanyl-D-alanine-carboxypeptidase/D-alanyl-D-alanine-endopeptidase
MHPRLTVAAAILALAAATPVLAQNSAVQPPAEAPAPTTFDEAVAQADAGFARWRDQAHIPGLIWGVVQDGRLRYVHFNGQRNLDAETPVDLNTRFRIASMSKAFTALAILKLRDEGRLSLDDLAETHVPEMADWAYPTTDSPRIRVRDLLNHVGGFVTDDPWGDRQQVMTEAEFTALLTTGVPFTRAPETAFEYSNFGYALLGRIVTNGSGRSYDQYIEQEIMRPLGMTSSGYDVFASDENQRALGYRWENDVWAREPDMAHGVFGAMGGVQTNAPDYAKWISFLLSAWPARDGDEIGPVRRSTVREMATGSNFLQATARLLPGGAPCATAAAYGMGFRVSSECEAGAMLSHGGGYPGYGSYMILLPERGLGLFAFANRTYAGPAAPLIEAANLIVRSGAAPARTTPVSDDLAAAYAATRRVWAAGDVAIAQDRLAMNFLMDRSAENWRTVFGALKEDAGACAVDSPVTATGAMSGTFDWTCEKGRVTGRVLLAPTTPWSIQAINFRLIPDQP